MIFYDIKSLTISDQQNVKPLHLLNEIVICLTLTEKKIYHFAPKFDAATLAGARVYIYGQRCNFFVSKWSRIFQIFLLIWTSKIPKMTLQKKKL